MHGCNNKDGSRRIDWGKTSQDYSLWRPDYPQDFYDRLSSLGVGLPEQTILDLGTGVGFLAIQFALQGACVTAVDISAGQIAEAKQRAREKNVTIQFLVTQAEETGLPSTSFDVITASQCWLYFDREKMVQEVHRLLRPKGALVTCHCCWLPRLDPIATASEQLVLKHNPQWTAADWHGKVPPLPEWVGDDFALTGMFVVDVPIAFTRESWRGRFRACRGIGATLSPEEIVLFDEEHDRLLRENVEEHFTVLHRIDAHILRSLKTKGKGAY